MKVLMVYENVPESTDIYVFDANDDEVADLKLSHGNYTNAVDDEDIEKALSRVLVRISDPKDCDDDWLSYCGAGKADAGKWRESKVDNSTAIIVKDSGIEMVVVAGMIM